MINLSKNPGNTSEDFTDDNKHDINDKGPKILREKIEKKKNPLASLKIGGAHGFWHTTHRNTWISLPGCILPQNPKSTDFDRPCRPESSP